MNEREIILETVLHIQSLTLLPVRYEKLCGTYLETKAGPTSVSSVLASLVQRD